MSSLTIFYNSHLQQELKRQIEFKRYFRRRFECRAKKNLFKKLIINILTVSPVLKI